MPKAVVLDAVVLDRQNLTLTCLSVRLYMYGGLFELCFSVHLCRAPMLCLSLCIVLRPPSYLHMPLVTWSI